MAPDDTGRAAGNLEFEPRPAIEPDVTPAYEPPGPYPGLGHAHASHDDHLDQAQEYGRTLGQPAPRGARWQPGADDSGPKPGAPTWRPPLSEEPVRAEAEPATASDSVWQAPAWLRPEEPAPPPTQAPAWTPTSHEQPATSIPTWGAPATPTSAAAPAWTPPASQVAETPSWTPEPDPRPRTQTPPIPELGLDDPAPGPGSLADDDEFVDGGFADEFDDDEFDDEPAGAVEARSRRRKGRTEVDAPEPAVTPAPAPVDEARPKAKPPKSKDDDDDFDDDDDDFDDFDDDDDDFDDDSHSSMSADLVGDGASITAAAQPRKLPWVPIAAVAGVLVLISTYLLQDTLFGPGDEQAEGDETGEVATNEPEPLPEPPPEPEPKPVEEPKPEPPAIPAEELDTLIADATNLVNRQKHDEASEIIDGILEKMPNEPRALSLRSIVQMENQDYDDALATATDCVEVDGDQANCWIVIAVVETTKENWPRALEGYNKYLEIAPDGRFAKSAKLEAKRLTGKIEG